MKKQLLALGFVMQAFFAFEVYGALLDIRNGELYGAFDVDVNGVLYDVAFLEGTCPDLFGGCDEQLDFPTVGSAGAQALLDQVFIDSPLGLFDINPTLTYGCNSPGGCTILTPAGLHANGQSYGTASAYNSLHEYNDYPYNLQRNLTFDTNPIPGYESYDSMVFAVWSEATAVPIPAAVWLFGTGLIGLVGLGRKMKK